MTSPRSAEETKVRSPGVEDRPTGGGHARGPANPTVAVSVVDSSGTGGEHLTPQVANVVVLLLFIWNTFACPSSHAHMYVIPSLKLTCSHLKMDGLKY